MEVVAEAVAVGKEVGILPDWEVDRVGVALDVVGEEVGSEEGIWDELHIEGYN